LNKTPPNLIVNIGIIVGITQIVGDVNLNIPANEAFYDSL